MFFQMFSKTYESIYGTWDIFHEIKICKNICPIFKLGDKDVPTNYRPISLLSNINKILERFYVHHTID